MVMVAALTLVISVMTPTGDLGSGWRGDGADVGSIKKTFLIINMS